jgi:BirA family biotin operon repressor/biotin-[acetyl-CoA-carboxylase] ligase
MAGSAKLAGILAEVPAEGAAVVVGMGLNVHGGPPGAAVLDQLAGRRISRGEVLAAWLFALEDLLDDWEATAERYRHTCATVGRRVEVEQLDGKRWRGRAEGIDEDGRLVVRAEDGDLMAISVGDVTHLRTPDP